MGTLRCVPKRVLMGKCLRWMTVWTMSLNTTMNLTLAGDSPWRPDRCAWEYKREHVQKRSSLKARKRIMASTSTANFRKCVPPCQCFLTRDDMHAICVMCMGEEHARSVLEGLFACIVKSFHWGSFALICPFPRGNPDSHLYPVVQDLLQPRRVGYWNHGVRRWSLQMSSRTVWIFIIHQWQARASASPWCTGSTFRNFWCIRWDGYWDVSGGEGGLRCF